MGDVKTRDEIKASLREWMHNTSRTEKVKKPIMDIQDMKAWWYLNFGVRMTDKFLVKALYVDSAIKA